MTYQTDDWPSDGDDKGPLDPAILERLAQQFAWELADEAFDNDADCNEISWPSGIAARSSCGGTANEPDVGPQP